MRYEVVTDLVGKVLGHGATSDKESLEAHAQLMPGAGQVVYELDLPKEFEEIAIEKLHDFLQDNDWMAFVTSRRDLSDGTGTVG